MGSWVSPMPSGPGAPGHRGAPEKVALGDPIEAKRTVTRSEMVPRCLFTAQVGGSGFDDQSRFL